MKELLKEVELTVKCELKRANKVHQHAMRHI